MIPKRFRLYFRYNHDLLGELARCGWWTVRDVCGFVLGEDYKAGMVGTIQTFDSLMLWDHHIHAIVTDGVWPLSRTLEPPGCVIFVDWASPQPPEVPTKPFLKV